MSETEGMRLDELLKELPADSRFSGESSARVCGVQQDSRRVSAGDLFVARRGTHADGVSFVAAARAKGAVALLTDFASDAPLNFPCIRVADVRVGMALAAAAVYGHPSRGLHVIGITGTNGKTTTAHLVRAAIDGALGRAACGIIGTVGHSFRAFSQTASHTTPEADELARVLRSMRELGATHVAMEVSSIALASHRTDGIRFAVGAFTNLTHDHLDYHGTMDAYAAAKATLFTPVAPASAVIHIGGGFGRELASRTATRLLRVSAELDTSPLEAEIAPISRTLSVRGIEAHVRIPGGTVDLASPLVGAHNLENLLVALGIVIAEGLDVSLAAEALRSERGAPGRLERCETQDDDVVVLVDYAHTPDALARVLSSVRPLARHRVWVVFGCGGDRDRAKRRPMGEAAGSGSDIAIVTNDNPRGEAPTEISRPIVDGLRSVGLAEFGLASLGANTRGFAVELDRSRAIECAIVSAAPGDTILICGKGHEDYQECRGERLPFDDRREAQRALATRRERVNPLRSGSY
jgi:UDP-N-acetylmuramoyl-L-alanyl-D-glutamate--2,6-diaminopimelate ligase